MTALAGYWDRGGRTEPAAACGRMLQAQQAYGSETARSQSSGPAALGSRLFPTLPVLSHVEIAKGVELRILGTIS